jgi:hypothetical protein
MSAGKPYEEAPLMYSVYLKDRGKAILAGVSRVWLPQITVNGSFMSNVEGGPTGILIIRIHDQDRESKLIVPVTGNLSPGATGCSRGL